MRLRSTRGQILEVVAARLRLALTVLAPKGRCWVLGSAGVEMPARATDREFGAEADRGQAPTGRRGRVIPRGPKLIQANSAAARQKPFGKSRKSSPVENGVISGDYRPPPAACPPPRTGATLQR
jgi:hypothetical protein